MALGEKEMLLMFPPVRLDPNFFRLSNASASRRHELFSIYDISLLKLIPLHHPGSVTFGNPKLANCYQDSHTNQASAKNNGITPT